MGVRCFQSNVPGDKWNNFDPLEKFSSIVQNVLEREGCHDRPCTFYQKQRTLTLKLFTCPTHHLLNPCACTRAKKQTPPPEDKKDTFETDTESMDGTFAISTFTTSEQEGAYALHDSFILDSASTIHVCNKRERFQTLRPANESDYLIAGASPRAWLSCHATQTPSAGRPVNTTKLTQSEWPSSVLRAAPVAVSQSLAVVSRDADATSLPSGENTTE